MARPVTLFTGQWADLPLEELAKKAAGWGYDGVELACWGDHFEVDKALEDDGYCKAKRDMLKKLGLEVYAISTHLNGQAICDNIDERHKAILAPEVWGDGEPEGVKKRAAEEVIKAAKAAKKLGIKVVNGFTGSSIWHMLYSFPPVTQDMIQAGYDDFAKRFMPILDEFKKLGIKFGLEVHPTEIAFDIVSAERAIEAVGGRYLILRTSWIYGLHGRNFLLTMLSRAKTQASLRVVDDQFGTPNWSRKVAEGTAGILSAFDDRPERLQSVAETYHLSAQGETSWCRFARAILEIVGDDPGVVAQKVEAVTTADYPTPAKRPKHSLLDCDKLKRDLGIQLAHWKQSLGDCLRERGRPET